MEIKILHQIKAHNKMKFFQSALYKNILILLVFGLGSVFLWYVINAKETRTLTVTANPPITIKTSVNTVSEACNDELWKHIYHSYRLKIISQCIKVTGTIEVIRIEKDGDDHILLRLDAGQENLINQKNISQQKGDLVLEPVCLNNVH